MPGLTTLGFRPPPQGVGFMPPITNRIDPMALLQYAMMGARPSGQPSILDAAGQLGFGHMLDGGNNQGFGADPNSIAAGNASAMAHRGFAPASLAGIGTALSNAAGLMMNAPKMGLASMMNQTGIMPEGFLGRMAKSFLGQGVQNIPGFSKFDPDLIEAVAKKRMSIGEAVAEQGRRSAMRDASRSSLGRGPSGHDVRGGVGAQGGAGVAGGYGGGPGGTARGPK